MGAESCADAIVHARDDEKTGVAKHTSSAHRSRTAARRKQRRTFRNACDIGKAENPRVSWTPIVTNYDFLSNTNLHTTGLKTGPSVK